MVMNQEIDTNLVPLPNGDGTIFIPRDELKSGERCKTCHILIEKEDDGKCFFCARNQ